MAIQKEYSIKIVEINRKNVRKIPKTAKIMLFSNFVLLSSILVLKNWKIFLKNKKNEKTHSNKTIIIDGALVTMCNDEILNQRSKKPQVKPGKSWLIIITITIICSHTPKVYHE